MRIPHDASPEVQQAFRELWDAIDLLTQRNIDMRGMRVTNAGSSVGPADYVTKTELNATKIAILELINK